MHYVNSADNNSDSGGDSFGEEIYEEVVVEKAPSTNDRKKNNLAMFEQMVGGYEDEEI